MKREILVAVGIGCVGLGVGGFFGHPLLGHHLFFPLSALGHAQGEITHESLIGVVSGMTVHGPAIE